MSFNNSSSTHSSDSLEHKIYYLFNWFEIFERQMTLRCSIILVMIQFNFFRFCCVVSSFFSSLSFTFLLAHTCQIHKKWWKFCYSFSLVFFLEEFLSAFTYIKSLFAKEDDDDDDNKKNQFSTICVVVEWASKQHLAKVPRVSA